MVVARVGDGLDLRVCGLSRRMKRGSEPAGNRRKRSRRWTPTSGWKSSRFVTVTTSRTGARNGFGGAGLQERDWSVLCNYVFAANGQVPDRIAALAEAIRDDIEATATKGSALEGSAPQVVALVDSGQNLTRNFFNALKQRERIRVDEIERFPARGSRQDTPEDT